MAESHHFLELLTQVLGGIVLGALFAGRRSIGRGMPRRLWLLQYGGLLLRGAALLAGFYLLAGASMVNLSLCTLGLALASLEMRRLAITSPVPSEHGVPATQDQSQWKSAACSHPC